MTRNFGLRHVEPESHLTRDAMMFIVGGLVFGVIGLCLGMGFAMVVG